MMNGSPEVETTQTSISWWMAEQKWQSYSMEYYPAVKRSEVGILTVTQTSLENMMLSEKRQTQKATYCESTLRKYPE